MIRLPWQLALAEQSRARGLHTAEEREAPAALAAAGVLPVRRAQLTRSSASHLQASSESCRLLRRWHASTMLCAAVLAALLVSPAVLTQGGQARAPAAAQPDASRRSLADGHARGHALHARREAGRRSRRQSLSTN